MTPDNIREFITWMREHVNDIRMVQLIGPGTRSALRHPKVVNYGTQGVEFAMTSSRTSPNISLRFQQATEVLFHEATPNASAYAEISIEGQQTLYINL